LLSENTGIFEYWNIGMMEKWNGGMIKLKYYLMSLLLLGAFSCKMEKQPSSFLSEIGEGWSQNSVNATIFRKNSVVSSKNYQFVAYYDSTATVVLARRKHNSNKWEISPTQYKGNVNDAHNSISIMADGEGYIHMSWDHHNNPLHYCRSAEPECLKMGDMEPMLGELENVVSYPEFYRLVDGDLLFAYRDGGSGNGNLVLNKYNLKTHKWSRLQSNLIDGQGKRNAYWQLCTDATGTIHISWVWRETPDVKSNHDLCYTCSKDGGQSWENSKSEVYKLPINIETAEVVCAIPQNSNLINQTSMTADNEGNPYIATYYKLRTDSCTQFHIIYFKNGKWKSTVATHRTLDFELGGVGSRSIPVSRPQILLKEQKGKKTIYMVYRVEEAGNQMILSSANVDDKMEWKSKIISPYSVDRWEPSFDTELWRTEQKLNLYFQKVGQGQGETSIEMEPQMVGVLEVNF
jgi:hypothetical protein